MTSLLFVVALAIVMTLVFWWGFRRLPSEEWQILATVPLRKSPNGDWLGLNLTFYGFFNATACAFACAMMLFLMSAIHVPWTATFSVIGLVLIIALPAAKVVARLVEGKRHTFTVGGASFVTIILLPWLIVLGNRALAPRLVVVIPVLPMLASVAIAYAFGESLGRLACISFGCCYGQSLAQLPARIQQRCRRFCFVFTGETKKAAYESHLSGIPLVPVQALTSIVFALGGLAGTLLFLRSFWAAAIIVPIATTQLWRVLSEFFRADYRGGGKISAYQAMALLALLYTSIALVFIGPVTTGTPSMADAFGEFASGWPIILIQLVWAAVFVYLGRSSVTASKLSFHVVRDRI